MSPQRRARRVGSVRTARETVELMICFALVSAAVFVAHVGYVHIIVRGFVSASRDVPWMSPLSYLFYFTLAGIPLCVAALWLPRAWTLRVATAVFAWLTVFTMLLPLTEIARVAAMILAAGTAAIPVRLMVSDQDRWLSRARRLWVGLAVGFVLLIAGSVGWRSARAWWLLSRAPAADVGAPNVLLVILDTVRASAMSLYGYARPTTPAIDTFARGGTVFDMAIVAAPWTLTSHASILTGKYPHTLSAGFFAPLDDTDPVLPEVMLGNGYHTVGVVANHAYTAWDSGLSRGFVDYLDHRRTVVQLLKSSWIGQSRLVGQMIATRSFVPRRIPQLADLAVNPMVGSHPRTATLVTDDFLRWERARDRDRPFFAMLNYFDAHAPYAPPARFARAFAPKPTARDRYDGEIAYVDRELGRLLRELERADGGRGTLVVITADHGEEFGEHGFQGHVGSLHLGVLRVPLVIRLDGRVPHGVRIAAPVTLRDLAATILHLTVPASAGRLPGASLASHWSGERGEQSPVVATVFRPFRRNEVGPSRFADMQSLMDSSWHLIRQRSGDDLLYAFRSDPEERNNRARDPAAAERLEAMRRELARVLGGDRRTTAPASSAPAPARDSGRRAPSETLRPE